MTTQIESVIDKKAKILRKVIIILGFVPGFGGILLGGAMTILGTLLIALTSGQSTLSYLSDNFSLHNLLLLFGMFFMEIYALAKMGKKKSKMFTVAMIFVALYFFFDAFNISNKIVEVFGNYTSPKDFSLLLTLLLFVVPIGLSICFLLSGIFDAKNIISYKPLQKIGIIIVALLIFKAVLNSLDNGNWFFAITGQLGVFSPMWIYMIFYPKNYIMPKYRQTTNNISEHPIQQPDSIVVTATPAHNSNDNIMNELERLKVLLDSNAITEDEYVALKEKVINKTSNN